MRHQKIIESPHFFPTSRFFLNLVVLVAITVFLSFMNNSLLAQRTTFREFERDMVHSPNELFRDIAKMMGRERALNNPLSGVDPEAIKKLTEAGREFFKDLSPEEKQKAIEFAKEHFPKKGFDSPEGLELLENMGVSEGMQKEIADQLRDLDGADFEKFRDLISGIGSRKGSFGQSSRSESNNGKGNGKGFPKGGTLNSGKGGAQLKDGKPNVIPGPNMGPDGPGEIDSQGMGSKTGKSKLGDGLTGKGKLGKGLGKSITDGAGKSLAQGRDPNSDGLGKGQLTKPGDLDPLGITGPQDDPFNPKSNGETDSIVDGTGKQIGVGKEQNGKELVGSENGNGKSSDLKTVDGQFDRDGKRVAENGAPKKSNPNGLKDPSGDDVLEKGTAKGGFDGRDAETKKKDESALAWAKAMALEQQLNKMKSGGSEAQEFGSHTASDAMKKMFGGMKGAFRDTLGKGTTSGLSKREIKRAFDRVMVETANKIESSKSGGAGSEEKSSFRKVIGETVDSIYETTKKRRQEERRKRREKSQNGSEQRGSEIGENGRPTSDSQGGFPGSDGSNSDNSGSSHLDLTKSTPSLPDLPSMPALPNINYSQLLLYGVLFCIAVFGAYLLVKNFWGVENQTSAERRFGRSFKSAKIRSTKDLVDAVDYFIVQKFGQGSRWWNAGHAQEILCAGAPGYSAKISDLLKDYVKARYTRAEVEMSDGDQQKYKSVLQELAKEVNIKPKKEELVEAETIVDRSSASKAEKSQLVEAAEVE